MVRVGFIVTLAAFQTAGKNTRGSLFTISILCGGGGGGAYRSSSLRSALSGFSCSVTSG
jgi:hypothetical protein